MHRAPTLLAIAGAAALWAAGCATPIEIPNADGSASPRFDGSPGGREFDVAPEGDMRRESDKGVSIGDGSIVPTMDVALGDAAPHGDALLGDGQPAVDAAGDALLGDALLGDALLGDAPLGDAAHLGDGSP